MANGSDVTRMLEVTIFFSDVGNIAYFSSCRGDNFMHSMGCGRSRREIMQLVTKPGCIADDLAFRSSCMVRAPPTAWRGRFRKNSRRKSSKALKSSYTRDVIEDSIKVSGAMVLAGQGKD